MTILSNDEIKKMLQFRGLDQERLHKTARGLREQHFGARIVVRAVIEITNACIVNCSYCPMRSDNKIDRYYLSEAVILGICKEIKKIGIKVVFLQAGEVPGTTKATISLIPKIRDLFQGNVEILLCLGNKSYEEYLALKNCGANSYILKFETSNTDLYQSLKDENIQDRLECLKNLQSLDYKVGTGFIANLPGQGLDGLVEDIVFASNADTEMVSVSPFIPAVGTPLQSSPTADFNVTLNALAILRILNPKSLIPTVSALEQMQEDGQYLGIMAGANVITINFSPTNQMSNYPIYGKDRFIVKPSHVFNILKRANLVADIGNDQKNDDFFL